MLRIRIAAALTFVILLAGPVQAGVATADLSVTKADSPDPVLAGSNVTYTITVQNLGPQDSNSVSLTDAVPPNTSFVSFAAPAGWASVTPPVGGTGTVISARAVLTVADGAQVFTLVVQINPGTPNGTAFTNTATLSSTTFDPTSANNSDIETTTVDPGAPSLPPPSAAPSLPNAATRALDASDPLVIVSFAVLLVGLLGVLALAGARRRHRT